MSEKNCIFIGGKQIGVNCLRKVLEAGVRPQLVVANMDDKGETLWHESLVKISKEAGLNTITGQKLRDTDVVDQIRKLEPEIIFCIGGMQIVPKEVLDIPKIGTINIHPALLPKYRGRYSTVHAIFNGDKYTGVTLHFMDEGLDSGPIILQQKFPIDKDDTAREVYDKFTNVGTALFEKFLSVWLSGKPIKSKHQDVGHIKGCQICGDDIAIVFSLGHQPVTQRYLTEETLHEPETLFPLNLSRCSNCGLLQLAYIVDPEVVFAQDYPYRTG